jgi:hypothetical protein
MNEFIVKLYEIYCQIKPALVCRRNRHVNALRTVKKEMWPLEALNENL